MGPIPFNPRNLKVDANGESFRQTAGPHDLSNEYGPLGCSTYWVDLGRRLATTNRYAALADMFCNSCDFADAIAVPIFIHKNDLKRLAPLWTAKALWPYALWPPEWF